MKAKGAKLVGREQPRLTHLVHGPWVKKGSRTSTRRRSSVARIGQQTEPREWVREGRNGAVQKGQWSRVDINKILPLCSDGDSARREMTIQATTSAVRMRQTEPRLTRIIRVHSSRRTGSVMLWALDGAL